MALVRGRLQDAKDLAHAHGAKVNDVVLAVVAGGLRDLLRSRGEPVHDLVLRAAVPVSLHRDVANEPANLDAGMSVPLPIGEPDPYRRLALIAADTAQRKQRADVALTAGVMAGRFVRRAILRRFDRQRLANVYVANVPGPPIPMYLAGMPLVELFPVVPLTGNLTLGVGVFSYAGQLNFTVVADRDGCPDIDVFAASMTTCLESMVTPERGHQRY